MYNISEKLELVHAHYEANTMKPPSRSRPHLPPVAPTRSSRSFSRAKTMHSAAPILPSCNYCSNPTHKDSKCNIPFEDFFCDYCGKEGHYEAVCFAKFSKRKQFWLPRQNLLTSFVALQPKAKALNFPFKLSPPRVIPIRMLRRKSTMLTRGKCFKPMPLKFKLYKINLNHWGPNLLI